MKNKKDYTALGCSNQRSTSENSKFFFFNLISK